MTLRRLTALTLAAMAASVALTAAASAEPGTDYRCMASNYYAYPYPEQEPPALTPTPEGYEPFHIEHYGRHGSRWHIGRQMYARPVEILEVGERNGRLTERGQQVLDQLRATDAASRGRDGELTAKGARQHRGIARRMYANFPEVFADSAFVTARSTPVVRCILSMGNELEELAGLNPALRITSDASYADLNYLNFEDPGAIAARNAGQDSFNDFERRDPFTYEFLDSLFTDRAFVADSIDRDGLLYHLFSLAANVQSHDDQADLLGLFTPAEIERKWRHNNAWWFIFAGNTPLTGRRAPFSQSNLLRNIIASADTALTSADRSANLRFGHEVVVLPLAVLMELDDYGCEIDNLDDVADRWRDYEIFPMASNVQMIFYRPVCGGGDPLVKVLLNERERRLPVELVEGHYYRWSDLRQYYIDKLNHQPADPK